MACGLLVPLQCKLGPPGKSVEYSFWNRKFSSLNAPMLPSTQSNVSFYVIVSGTKHFVEWKFCQILFQHWFGSHMGMGVCQELGPVKMVREDKGMDKMGVHRARPWEGETGVNLPFRLTDLFVESCHLQVPQPWALHAGLQKESPILSSSFFGEVDMNTKVGMNTRGGAVIVSLVFAVSWSSIFTIML